VSFSNVMEQRRPDQVLALGVRGGDIPGTGESVAKIGDGLTEERDYLGGSQAGLRLSLFVEGQRSGADEVDQPPCQVAPGAWSHLPWDQDRFDLQSTQ
jgi:hypothetical protein